MLLGGERGAFPLSRWGANTERSAAVSDAQLGSWESWHASAQTDAAHVCGNACVALHYSVSVQHVCKLERCCQAGLPGQACPVSDGGRLDFSDLALLAALWKRSCCRFCIAVLRKSLVIPSFCFLCLFFLSLHLLHQIVWFSRGNGFYDLDSVSWFLFTLWEEEIWCCNLKSSVWICILYF